jgi:glutaredoxin
LVCPIRNIKPTLDTKSGLEFTERLLPTQSSHSPVKKQSAGKDAKNNQYNRTSPDIFFGDGAGIGREFRLQQGEHKARAAGMRECQVVLFG